MIAIENHTNPTGILTDTFAVPDASPLPRPRDSAAARHSEPGSTEGVKFLSSQALTTWIHELAHDARNPNVTTFPFALGVYLTLMTGSIALGWGMLLGSVWLAVTGSLIALAGCALYGVSQNDA